MNNPGISIVAHGGGNGLSCPFCGGGGAGGAIKLIANSVVGGISGLNLSAMGGPGAPSGVIRIEALNVGSVISAPPFLQSTPGRLILPATPPPTIKVTSIGGMPVNANPFLFPDAQINTTAAIDVVIEARYVPQNTRPVVYIWSETGQDQVIPAPPLTGNSIALTTTTVQVPFQTGGSRGYVKATW